MRRTGRGKRAENGLNLVRYQRHYREMRAETKLKGKRSTTTIETSGCVRTAKRLVVLSVTTCCWQLRPWAPHAAAQLWPVGAAAEG